MLPLANRGWGERGSDPRPLYRSEGNLVTDRSVEPEQWGRFLIGVFDEWVQRDVGTVFVQMFDAALASWVGVPPAMCIFNETCGNGARARAQRRPLLVRSLRRAEAPARQHPAGAHAAARDLGAAAAVRPAKRDTLPRYCRECAVRFACHGECPKNRFIATPDGEPGLNYLCAGYKAFFTHIDRPMRMMADLLRRGRYADEVMGCLEQERSRRSSAGPDATTRVRAAAETSSSDAMVRVMNTIRLARRRRGPLRRHESEVDPTRDRTEELEVVSSPYPWASSRWRARRTRRRKGQIP